MVRNGLPPRLHRAEELRYEHARHGASCCAANVAATTWYKECKRRTTSRKNCDRMAMLLVFDKLIAERTLDCSRCQSRVDMINTCCICVFSETQLFECHGLSCFSDSANCTRTTHPKASSIWEDSMLPARFERDRCVEGQVLSKYSTNIVRGVDNELWKTLAVTMYVSTSLLLGFGKHVMHSDSSHFMSVFGYCCRTTLILVVRLSQPGTI